MKLTFCLKDHPVTLSQDGNTVTIRSRRNGVTL
jgi:hypothetical protein